MPDKKEFEMPTDLKSLDAEQAPPSNDSTGGGAASKASADIAREEGLKDNYTEQERRAIKIYGLYKDGKVYKDIAAETGVNAKNVLTQAKAGAALLGEELVKRGRGKGGAPRPTPADIDMGTPTAPQAATSAMPKDFWGNIIGAVHELTANFTKCDEFRLSPAEKTSMGGAFYDAFKDSKFATLEKNGKYVALFAAIAAVEMPLITKGMKAYKTKLQRSRATSGVSSAATSAEESVPTAPPLVVVETPKTPPKEKGSNDAKK